jgi:hypothetical protein
MNSVTPPPPSHSSRFVSIGVAASLLGLCTKTLRRWDAEGSFKPVFAFQVITVAMTAFTYLLFSVITYPTPPTLHLILTTLFLKRAPYTPLFIPVCPPLDKKTPVNLPASNSPLETIVTREAIISLLNTPMSVPV